MPTGPAPGAEGNLTGPRLFVGVGAAKAGTSWLSERLSRHPEVYMSPVKEMHWFDSATIKARFDRSFARRAAGVLDRIAEGGRISEHGAGVLRRLSLRDDADYLRYFQMGRNPEHRAFGEFSPSYSLLDASGLERIVSVHPETCLLFIMRNPADRFWSQVKYRWTRVGREPPSSLGDVDFRGQPFEGTRSRGDYAATIDAMFTVAPPGRLFISFYEDLFQPGRHEVELRRLWDILGVTPEPTPETDLAQRVNVSAGSGLAADERQHLVDLLSRTYVGVLERLGRVPDSWRRDMEDYL